MENENKDAATENNSLEQEIKIREEKITGLEKSLAEKDREIAAVKKSLDEAQKAIVETSLDLSQAVVAYKELVGQANPSPVAEMVKGNTIAEINASLKGARELVSKVRQEVGAENARVRVPAGAPQRTSADLSALSAREKIRFGMGNG
jgi:chromosome segregation ATPase